MSKKRNVVLVVSAFLFLASSVYAQEEKYKNIPKLEKFNVPKGNFWSRLINEGSPHYYGQGTMDTNEGTAVRMMASKVKAKTRACACYRFEVKEEKKYRLITRNKYFYAGGENVYTPHLFISLCMFDSSGSYIGARTIYKGNLKPGDPYTTNTSYKIVTIDLGRLSPGGYKVETYFGSHDIWEEDAPDDGKSRTRDDAYWYWDWVAMVPVLEEMVKKGKDTGSLNKREKKTESPVENSKAFNTIVNPGFELNTGWKLSMKGKAWKGNYDNTVSYSKKKAYKFAYPRRTPSRLGEYIQISQRITIPPSEKGYGITFRVKDNYSGKTSGYYYQQVLIDGKVIWEKDVAGGTPDWKKVAVDITEFVKDKETVELILRLYERFAVGSLGIAVWWDDISLLNKSLMKKTRLQEKFPDWFAPSMLRESFLVRQPLNELDGKFFMFFKPWHCCPFNSTRLRTWFRQLKWMGVTDIIHNRGNCGAKVGWPTKIPYSKPEPYLSNFPHGTDPLMMVMKAAYQEGLDVWLLGHSGNYDEIMSAKDENGKLYAFRGNRYDDLLSPKLRQFLFSLFDELIDKYNIYGNLKGYYYDEIMFNSHDYHGDDISLYADFCKKNFGEEVPKNIKERFAKEWRGPPDKWRARYTLFKNKVYADFLKDIIDYLHKKGLKSILELRPTAVLPFWSWQGGMDNNLLTKLGADHYFVATGDYCEPCFVYPNAIIGSHFYRSWGYYNTTAFRGQHGVHFLFTSAWKPMLTAPRYLEETKAFIRNNKEWYGAKSLTRAAILTNQLGLAMSLPSGKCKEEAVKEVNLLNKLSLYQDLDMLLVREKDYYQHYRLLLAPKHSLSFLPSETIKGLESYIKNGGAVISLGGRWSTSRQDLTQEKEVGEKFLGVKYLKKHNIEKSIKFTDKNMEALPIGSQDVRLVEPANSRTKVIARFADSDAPAITELPMGKGKVIAFHFDITEWLGKTKKEKIRKDGLIIESSLKDSNKDKKKIKGEEYLANVVTSCSHPEIRTDGNLQIKTTLKKNNWAAVSLYSKKCPAQGIVYIDPVKLGIETEKKKYRVFLLSRNRELPAPYDFGERRYWTDVELAKGISITIPKNNHMDLKLPKSFPAESKTGGHLMRKYIYERWEKRPEYRSYEYEIVVILPYNELTIAGETVETK